MPYGECGNIIKMKTGKERYHAGVGVVTVGIVFCAVASTQEKPMEALVECGQAAINSGVIGAPTSCKPRFSRGRAPRESPRAKLP